MAGQCCTLTRVATTPAGLPKSFVAAAAAAAAADRFLRSPYRASSTAPASVLTTLPLSEGLPVAAQLSSCSSFSLSSDRGVGSPPPVAMPRNVLAIPAKTSPLASTAFSKALREHIHSHFTDTHPDAFADDLKSIARLRDAITHSDVHVASIEAAQKYYAQLVFMCTKFPADINLAFPWTVAFPPTLSLFSISLGSDESPDTEDNGENAAAAESSSAPAKSYTKTSGSRHIVAHPDLHYERAAVLFSLASLYSAIGASEPRSEGESIKRAIAAFQAAAGVLQHLLAEVIPMLTSLWAGTRSRYVDADLQPAMLACLRDSMLAQAQECFWQKAVVDRLKDATIARLASRVSELYASALDYATTGGPLETSEDGFPRGCELPKVSAVGV